MLVLCNARVIIEYDGRRLGLSSAPVDMEHENNRIEESTNRNSSKHHQQQTPTFISIFTYTYRSISLSLSEYTLPRALALAFSILKMSALSFDTILCVILS